MGSLYINCSQVVMINKKLRTVVPKITATYILLIKIEKVVHSILLQTILCIKMELKGLQYIHIIQEEDINLLNSPIKRFAKAANIYIQSCSQFVKYEFS